ncbi:hypothetical protein LR68_04331 [Anoxybacillus sp. BCO1]|nr:hypothetical protein LR68_04331 [Anoxybacillus sp. BCO1]
MYKKYDKSRFSPEQEKISISELDAITNEY